MSREGQPLVGEDFGARDPFAGEIASDFGNKVLGNADTEHKIKVPILRGIVGLSARSCQKLGPDTKALSPEEANDLRKQILGWKLLEGPSGELRLQREWTLRNFPSGLELFQRISKVAEEQGHHPDLHLTGWNKARVELYSHELGGLSENDFILAAKVEEIDTSDLIKKIKKFWA
ncbi:pterin-4-alpha-carbinolamine dehydratase [Klebsormidium nitens]|uniref:4a-hydroxytetrahydrobiopterin dehydratase n=1 Tax=Klebsormidium nitens TaxID=105231 RepID=A0A1Y1HHE3_KLENI|nr:pterin-4-alpha-carbinolamine dehydratase [Klebsormidium nitens]|eukprot:GAQ77875.1 pterin-4-alpha-carbinolamine dehydratase [Klebsormidium nitens]